jgi:hypothetical protein
MLAFPDVVYFFADELSRLGRRRFSFSFVFARSCQCCLFWHDILLSVELHPANGLLPDPRKTILEILKQYFRRAEVALAIAHQHSSLGASKGIEKAAVTEFVFYAR